jgi:HEAT repeat protein
MLRDEQIRRRQVSADWLANRAPDPTRQKEVAQALEPLLEDAQTRDQAARALARWATKDNVPALTKALEFEGGNAWRPLIEALARLKDERAAAVLAAQLAVFPRGDDASRALQAIGPAAAKEVVKYVHHPKDFGARQKASQLLKRFNVKDDVLITQCVADLASADAETKRLAAEDLAKVQASAGQRDEVARALDPLVTDTDFRTRNAAVTALGTWAIKDNALSLAKALDDGGVRDKALAILVSLKPVDNEQALALVAQHLQKPDRRRFSVALVQMGKPAVVEKLAVAVLTNPANDTFTRQEAVEMLALVGSKASLLPLQTAARAAAAQNDRMLAGKCLAAIKAIQTRVKKGG